MVAHLMTKFGYLITLPVLIIIGNFLDKISTASGQQQQLMTHKQMLTSKVISISDSEALSGYIYSPNYPQPYPINASSFASITVSGLNTSIDTVRLTFEQLQLEQSNFCEGEAVEILQTSNIHATLKSSNSKARRIYSFCGNYLPQPVLIHSRRLFIHFFSDAFGSGKNIGFKIKFDFLDSMTQIFDGCDRRSHFKCRNRRCIPNQLKCNRQDDCGDASDEDITTPCPNLPTIAYGIDYKCGLLKPGSASTRKTPPSSGNAWPLLANRINGGTRVSRQHGWPFQVSIQIMRIEPVAHFCGAALIHPLFVLSAAHCFKGLMLSSDYKFVFGAQDLRTGGLDSPIQVRYANSISIYPGGVMLPNLDDLSARQVDLANDLALIELNAPVRLSSHVWPACLPHLSEPLVAGRQCLASGYGDTRGTGHPLTLKHSDQVIQHSSTCQSLYSDFEVDDYSMICVKNKLSNGPCTGDSGGPLFCTDQNNQPVPLSISVLEAQQSTEANIQNLEPGAIIRYLPIVADDETYPRDTTSIIKTKAQIRYTVHGITSFTTDGNFGGGFCGLDKVPTIYSRVSTKVEWILSKMKMAMFSLSREDRQQNINNRSALFGYLFRSGLSRHKDLTRLMTIIDN